MNVPIFPFNQYNAFYFNIIVLNIKDNAVDGNLLASKINIGIHITFPDMLHLVACNSSVIQISPPNINASNFGASSSYYQGDLVRYIANNNPTAKGSQEDIVLSNNVGINVNDFKLLIYSCYICNDLCPLPTSGVFIVKVIFIVLFMITPILYVIWVLFGSYNDKVLGDFKGQLDHVGYYEELNTNENNIDDNNNKDNSLKYDVDIKFNK